MTSMNSKATRMPQFDLLRIVAILIIFNYRSNEVLFILSLLMNTKIQFFQIYFVLSIPKLQL